VSSSPVNRLVVEIDVLPFALRGGWVTDFAGLQIAHLLRAPLLEEADGSSQVKPGLLREILPLRDHSEWRLVLRDDARWSDGAPVTSDDVKLTLSTRFAEGRSPSRWLLNLLGASFSELNSTPVTAQVVNAQTLDLKLHRRVSYLPALFTHDFFSPDCPEKSGPRSRHTGAFSVQGLLRDERGYVLGANGVEGAGPKEIVFLKTDDAYQGIRLFEQGIVDVTCNTTFPASEMSRWRNAPCLFRKPLNLAVQLQCNSANHFLSRPGARHAIAAAIDHRALAEVTGGLLSPIECYLDLWRGECTNSTARSPRKRVHRGRVPDCLTITHANFPPNDSICRILCNQIAAALRTKVTSRPVSYPEYLNAIRTQEYELILAIISPGYHDPSGLYEMFRRGAPLACETGFESCAYEKLVNAAAGEQAQFRRYSYYQAAEELLSEEMPVIPLLRFHSVLLRNSKLRDFDVTPSGRLPSSAFSN
jgi:ABC-type transport system substrate-binding protein